MIKLTLIAVLVILSSCAQQQVMLSGSDMPYASASKITKLAFATKELEITEVVDSRENMTDVGVARTGVQYAETPVRLKEAVPQYVETYFKNALYKRNIIVEKDQNIKLQIVVNKLWLSEVLKNNEAAKCEADFSFVAHEDQRTWKGNIWTEYKSQGDLGDGTDKMGPTLSTCMNNVIEKLVTDKTFIKFIKRI